MNNTLTLAHSASARTILRREKCLVSSANRYGNDLVPVCYSDATGAILSDLAQYVLFC